MVNGNEPPRGGKTPGSQGCNLLLPSSQILFLALDPLNTPVPLLAARSAAVIQPLDFVCLILSACRKVAHNKLHNCTLWSCPFRFSVLKFLLSLEDIIQYLCAAQQKQIIKTSY